MGEDCAVGKVMKHRNSFPGMPKLTMSSDLGVICGLTLGGAGGYIFLAFP